MDPTAEATEGVPILYRTILDLVEELERRDRRDEAARIRSKALAAYATAWDERQRQHLERLHRQLVRSLAQDRRRSWLRLP